ncbi:MAG: hypothetical protein AB1659_07985 [Thermodesulfobacteriota bacterium]
MTHHHDQNHGHDDSNLTFEGKLIKLLEHWIRHNEEHARNYRDWGRKANENRLGEVGRLLEAAAEATARADEKFKEAVSHLNKSRRLGHSHSGPEGLNS